MLAWDWSVICSSLLWAADTAWLCDEKKLGRVIAKLSRWRLNAIGYVVYERLGSLFAV
jgi:hypothetical protein